MGIADWRIRAKALRQEVYALYLCTRHPNTPLYAKVFALLVVTYALSPIDLIPDFIPILGYIDDLVVIPCGIALLIRMMPRDVLEECRLEARALPDGTPVRWAGGVLMVCLWALAIYATILIIKRMVGN